MSKLVARVHAGGSNTQLRGREKKRMLQRVQMVRIVEIDEAHHSHPLQRRAKLRSRPLTHSRTHERDQCLGGGH
jgi:hypothetical protein